MKKLISFLLVSTMVLSLCACASNSTSSAQVESTTGAVEEKSGPSGSLVVYSPHDSDPLNAGIKMFETAYPNVKVEVIAQGTGDLLNKIKAEAAAPQCDVIWGGGADSLAAFNDYFTPYKPSCMDKIDSSLADPNYLWIGESPLPMVFIVDKNQVSDADMPHTWKDLADPKWKGKIVMANPASSGSAYTQLCTMFMLYGKVDDDYKDGWEFVKSLKDNLVIQNSSSSAHKLIDSGEYPIGITLEKAAVGYDLENGHLAMIYPEDGTSAVPDGVAIVKGCPNFELAKLFVEYVLSEECQKAQNIDWKRRPIRSDVTPQGLEELGKIKLMDYNFSYAGNNKADIVDMWKEIIAE